MKNAYAIWKNKDGDITIADLYGKDQGEQVIKDVSQWEIVKGGFVTWIAAHDFLMRVSR